MAKRKGQTDIQWSTKHYTGNQLYNIEFYMS